jgi:hypothetical protein
MIPTNSNLDDSTHSFESTEERISANPNPKQETFSSSNVCCCNKNKHDEKRMTILPHTFTPGNFDVICARGIQARNHMGNRLFRRKIKESAKVYGKADSKVLKSLVVSTVINWIRKLSPDGGFVKQVNGVWYEVGEDYAREKIGQGLREKNHHQYKSTTKAKRCRWKKENVGTDASFIHAIQSNRRIVERMDLVEGQRKELGGNHASDESLLELFTQNNNFILKTIRTDPQLQASLKILSSCYD